MRIDIEKIKNFTNIELKGRALFFSFRIVVLFLLLFQLPLGHLSYADAQTKEIMTYPDTPEGVVEAYVKAVFDMIEVEKLADGNVEGRTKYYAQEALHDPTPGYDCLPIALGYQIKKSKVDDNKSTVEVVYDDMGEDIGDLCGESLEKRKKFKHEVIFHLVKEKGLWKIRSPDPMCISVNTAIRLSEYLMKNHPERKEKIKKTISILKKYLKNSAN